MVRNRARRIADHLESSPINERPCEEESILLNYLRSISRRSRHKFFLFGCSDFKNAGDQALWFSLNRVLESVNEPELTIPLISEPLILAHEEEGESTFLFPGGGSLGNRYNSSRRRIELLEKNPSTGFVQMPVSTTFSDDEALLDRLRSTYNREGGSVFVRDSRSMLEAEKKIGLSPTMVPDLVEFLPECHRFSSGEFGTLHLLRTDRETTGSRNAAKNRCLHATDWSDFVSRETIKLRTQTVVFGALSRLLRRSGYLNTSHAVASLRIKLAREFALHDTALALSYLSFFERIVTDRLHGVILARNLDLRVEAIDNDHGKLARYTNTWKQRYDGVVFRDQV